MMSLYGLLHQQPERVDDSWSSTQFAACLQPVIELLNKYGSADITVAGGQYVGFYGNLSLSRSGLSGSAGLGFGLGAGVSLTGGGMTSTTRGWGFNGTIAGGSGVGGYVSSGLSKGGTLLGLGGGVGLGVGGSITFGYTGSLLSW
jgi:hypothetical protein